ncbi:MAG TPA: tetratricopeptide repeat protein [Spirochaetia bacterium]|nr:tetratricopeptide repeat protein [Spirochaetia bacterium]
MTRRYALLVLLVSVSFTATAQESLDRYYAFPLSVDVDYAPLTPVLGATRTATANGIAGRVRFPIPGMPVLQPQVGAGLLMFNSDEAAVPAVIGGTLDADATLPDYDPRSVWDHSYAFGSIGVGYARRLTRNFELGLDVSAGLGQARFDQRFVTPEGSWQPVSTTGLSLSSTARIRLNPSYNLSISVSPTFRYGQTLGAMRDYDGLYFGVGLGASYRFGRDPDAPLPDIRALRVGEIDMPPVFAAMQSVYVEEPITTFELSNTSGETLTDVTVLFNQPGFMDSPTPSARIGTLAPGESATLPIHASFNREVFSTNGVTPLNGELVFRYSYDGRPIEQRESVTYDLHDRNALTWTDDRKVAAFITSSDSAIRNYASFIRSASRNDGTEYFPDSLEFAMQAYHALSALGILYQPDPTSPFTQVQENTLLVDSISLPRQTLRSITGDCDDLTVLFNSMLESVGVKTGFVTLPGHIYTAINTEVDPQNYAQVHTDPDMTIEHDGSLWILVEITLVGEASFVEAWRTGMRQWRAYAERENLRSFHTTAASQRLFRAVGLTESDLGLQYGDPGAFLASYRNDMERLSAEVLRPVIDRAESRRNPRTWNHVGVLAGKLRRFDAASDAFETASLLDRDYVNPLINMGSLEYLQGNHDAAIRHYRRAENLISLNPEAVATDVAVSVYLNLSRVLYEVSEFDEANRYVEIAEQLDAERVAEYGRMATTAGEEGARASQRTLRSILFVEDAEE